MKSIRPKLEGVVTDGIEPSMLAVMACGLARINKNGDVTRDGTTTITCCASPIGVKTGI
jgi:hypothetical protein